MTKQLVIVFVKNIELGKVKTRLAKTISNQGAFHVYSELVKITKTVIKNIDVDTYVFFSKRIEQTEWNNSKKFVQDGNDLGERMKNAFAKAFQDGYEAVILIGSDLPDINSAHILSGLKKLKTSNVVFGPAADGGYYLVGMTKVYNTIFDNKPWSQSNLLESTLKELQQQKLSYTLLETLNDIDTFEDLEQSNLYKTNIRLQEQLKILKA